MRITQTGKAASKVAACSVCLRNNIFAKNIKESAKAGFFIKKKTLAVMARPSRLALTAKPRYNKE
jgi:hypothetical protein